MPGDGQMKPHRLQIDADRYRFEQVCAELRGFGFGNSFENGVGQTRKPFRPSQLNRESGMVILVERTADKTASTAIEIGTLDDFIRCTMGSKAGLIFGLDSRVVMV